MSRRRSGHDGDDPNQLRIEWGTSEHRGKSTGNGDAAAAATPPTAPVNPEPSLKTTHRERIRRRAVARLPVPRPLASAVKGRHFGEDEDGKPVRPGACEVREITKRYAEKLIDLIAPLPQMPSDHRKTALELQFIDAIAIYAEDFGLSAALQLEAYVRRQAGLDSPSHRKR